jgi:putative ABC transport system permease protein
MPDQAAELEFAGAALEETKAQLDQQQATIDAGYEEANSNLAALKSKIAAAEQGLEDGYAELEEAEAALKDGKAEYEQAKEDAETEISDAEAEISDAEAEIADAEAEIAAVKPAEWYVLGRDSNSGYADYREDADRIGALANMFPIIFFLVAMLVSLTTMTRMVDEKRMEIGTLKALGYGKMTTTGKFVGYSAAATVNGALIGIAIGMKLMPWFIFQAYSIMYNLPYLETPVLLDTILLASVAALVCTVGATVAACEATLRETPASLLRPKAPKAGKRVFLERVRPVWKRMSFFGKVSVRNLFRYKKRLIMTIVGIAGCTALIVTGFGLRDSIRNITSMQFDQIEKFDLRAYLNDDATEMRKASCWMRLKTTRSSGISCTLTRKLLISSPIPPHRKGS